MGEAEGEQVQEGADWVLEGGRIDSSYAVYILTPFPDLMLQHRSMQTYRSKMAIAHQSIHIPPRCEGLPPGKRTIT